MTQPALRPEAHPIIQRFATIADLDRRAIDALGAALASAKAMPARSELQTEGQRIGAARIVTAGWAARVRVLADGRRQFLSFLLPGDMLGLCEQVGPLAISTVVTLTPVKLCLAPSADDRPALADAYAASRALHEAYLLEQIVRLGRLSALERIASLFLELHERLSMVGLASAGGFDLPLTQEMLGDALGLTPVHVNRMLKQARGNGDIVWHGGRVTLGQPADLASRVGREPARVSSR